jgi:anti-sigma regulatory factor (Ser/Thr protein kinase)
MPWRLLVFYPFHGVMQLEALSATPDMGALEGAELAGPPSRLAHMPIDMAENQPIRNVRHWAEQWLEGWPLPKLTRDLASVVISELLTNAVIASSSLPSAQLVPDPSPVLSLCIQDHGFAYGDTSERFGVVVVVSDFGAGGPEPRAVGEYDEGGRGLIVVDGLCDSIELVRGAYTADGTISPYGKRVIAMIASALEGSS